MFGYDHIQEAWGIDVVEDHLHMFLGVGGFHKVKLKFKKINTYAESTFYFKNVYVEYNKLKEDNIRSVYDFKHKLVSYEKIEDSVSVA